MVYLLTYPNNILSVSNFKRLQPFGVSQLGNLAETRDFLVSKSDSAS